MEPRRTGRLADGLQSQTWRVQSDALDTGVLA